MTAVDLFTIADARLRNALSDIAGAFTRDYSTQKTLLAHAWIAISEKPADYTTEAYIGIGYAVMRHKWEVYYASPPKRWRSDDPAGRRAKKELKKYVKSGV
jgi:hypothetical protein